jgi:hypothetical protein
MRRLSEALMRFSAPSGVLAFWFGMAAAAHAYPTSYDWRYQTISLLLYPDRNPDGYIWAWAGLVLCGLCGIAWSTELRRRLEAATARSSLRGARLLQAGFVCMCLAVVPGRLLPVPKGHEILAIAAFLAICLGVIQALFLTLDRIAVHRPPKIGTRLRASIAAGVPLVPLVLAAITQAYLTLERPHVPWVSPAWRTLGIPIYLSFALWEWVSCVLFSVCVLLLWRLMSTSGRPLLIRRAAHYLVIAALLCLPTMRAHAACRAGKLDSHPTSRYVLKGAKAFDKKTKLTWQRCSVGQSWRDDKGCVGEIQGLTLLQAKLLEQDGWRLPTIEELKSLVSPNCSRPSINDTVFPGMDVQNLYYWSSTSPRESELDYLNFEAGTVSADGDEEPYSVRLVRSAL